MFALKLDLEHAVLVHKQRFVSIEEAREFAKTLPGNFEVIDEKDVPEKCVEIPIKEKACHKP